MLRPVKQNKLELSWKGPYSVLKQTGIADYQVQVGTKTKIFHANLLKRFVERKVQIPKRQAAVGVELEDEEVHAPKRQAAMVIEPESEEVTPVSKKDIPVCPLKATEGPEDVTIGAEDPEFADLLRSLVCEFGDVLTDMPACTTLETYSIQMNDETPVRCRMYPIPFNLWDAVNEEVKSMLQLGVIEPSVSPFRLRLC